MADDPDIPDTPKREWYDGQERVCDGAVVEYRDAGRHWSRPLAVRETPKEVNALMKAGKPNDMLELHHYADANTSVFIRNKYIISIDAKWHLIEDD